MPDTSSNIPRFACDAMLGGLARWLRAAGYDAWWHADVDDWQLVRRALREGRILLTCDAGISRIGIVRDGEVSALLLPVGLSKKQQLRYVFEQLGLNPLPPRCMACGGELRPVSKEAVKDRAPPRTYAWLDQFQECTRCSRLFWPGTHWQRIGKVLDQIADSTQ